MKIFDSVFYHSNISIYKTKHKNSAEARSIGFVIIYSIGLAA